VGTEAEAEGWERLFSPGQRVGWEFRDRRRHWLPFTEPPPPSPGIDPELHADLDRARAGCFWGLVGGLLALVAGLYVAVFVGPPAQLLSTRTAIVAAVLLVALWLLVWRPLRLSIRERQARLDVETAWAASEADHRAAVDAHSRRAQTHHTAEWERANRAPEWGAIRPEAGARRLDLFGGSLAGWEGFLTTYGSSLVAEAPPLRVLDLSQALVAGELCRLAAARDLVVDAQELPRESAASDLLAGLDARQLTDVLVESLHGDRADSSREARALDARLLGAVCESLEPGLSLARLAERLQALVEGRETAPFSPDYLRQTGDRLRSLEADIHPLRELGAGPVRPQPRDAALECLMVGDDQGLVSADLFVDLALQWCLRGLRDEPGGWLPGALVVAGADRLRRRHLESLADACERRSVRLTCLHRHLRGEAADLLGAAPATAFMRLGNLEEAERAARFIGVGHRFVLSQVTRSHGGRQDWRADETRSETRLTTGVPGRHGWSRTRGRTWGVTRGFAEGVNWHYAEVSERVTELTVEPAALQSLPDYALLLVERGELSGGPDGRPLTARTHLRVADCNPDLVSLPGVSMEPFATVEEVEPTALPPP
jgi:hypothetical protein